jgi:hypothetical protein
MDQQAEANAVVESGIPGDKNSAPPCFDNRKLASAVPFFAHQLRSLHFDISSDKVELRSTRNRTTASERLLEHTRKILFSPAERSG